MDPVEFRIRVEIRYANEKSLLLERHESWEELSHLQNMTVFDALTEVARILIKTLRDVYYGHIKP